MYFELGSQHPSFSKGLKMLYVQVDGWMKEVDFDDDGHVSFEEFQFSICGNLGERI